MKTDGNRWKLLENVNQKIPCSISKSCSEFCSCCTALKNGRQVSELGGSAPKLAGAAEQALTKVGVGKDQA